MIINQEGSRRISPTPTHESGAQSYGRAYSGSKIIPLGTPQQTIFFPVKIISKEEYLLLVKSK